eukprot:CAMPEP_0113847440 /NCGR_PEP_ID=MMETSP0372-20130328/1874_1 /TAXON_ID=340204 /ORGANISM="Lankesteria abbotti" /LENGTH=55 /DNA_ID=CAMNT_0000816715 /DNA_START=317 /DNA_END=484 /DNA_ORIENTATION=- /assembly_acc=CAM_ASM_000359
MTTTFCASSFCASFCDRGMVWDCDSVAIGEVMEDENVAKGMKDAADVADVVDLRE